jgi:hypothetical protein
MPFSSKTTIVIFPEKSIPSIPRSGNLFAKYRYVECFSHVRQLYIAVSPEEDVFPFIRRKIFPPNIVG